LKKLKNSGLRQLNLTRRYSKNILIGATSNAIVTVQLDIGDIYENTRCHNRPCLALCGVIYDRDLVTLGIGLRIGVGQQETGVGQINGRFEPSMFERLAVTSDEADQVWETWSQLHLTPLSKVSLLELFRIKMIFEKYPAFEKLQLQHFTLHPQP